MIKPIWLIIGECDPPKTDVDNLKNIEVPRAYRLALPPKWTRPITGSDVSLMVHAYQGAPEINVPLVRQGEALAASDLRAAAVWWTNPLPGRTRRAGDSQLTLNKKTDYTFWVRGIAAAGAGGHHQSDA